MGGRVDALCSIDRDPGAQTLPPCPHVGHPWRLCPLARGAKRDRASQRRSSRQCRGRRLKRGHLTCRTRPRASSRGDAANTAGNRRQGAPRTALIGCPHRVLSCQHCSFCCLDLDSPASAVSPALYPQHPQLPRYCWRGVHGLLIIMHSQVPHGNGCWTRMLKTRVDARHCLFSSTRPRTLAGGGLGRDGARAHGLSGSRARVRHESCLRIQSAALPARCCSRCCCADAVACSSAELERAPLAAGPGVTVAAWSQSHTSVNQRRTRQLWVRVQGETVSTADAAADAHCPWCLCESAVLHMHGQVTTDTVL